MKKIIILFTLVFTLMCSTVAFAECNLDTTRWKWVASDNESSFYYDSKTLHVLNNHIVEFWLCIYHPFGCDTFKSEHYHNRLVCFDYNRNLMGEKVFITRDSKGYILSDSSFKDYFYHIIVPDSFVETLFLTIRQDVFGR